MSFNYLSKFGFDSNTELDKKVILMRDNEILNKKLMGAVFFYQAKKQTGISFYSIECDLNDSELQEVRKYLWNKNDADLFLHYYDSKLDIIYVKVSPEEGKDKYLIKTFEGKDIEKVQEIQKWQFDSGAFWLNYQNFLDKAKKYKLIDKVLVETLADLKSELYKEISTIEQKEDKRQEIVQALIDRTLYIKFLEDKQIINSYFHQHYFNDEKADFKFLLENKRTQDINQLFGLVHQIFNNQLFETPKVDEKYLTESVCKLIATSFNRDGKGQLRLFDFQFDVMPVEFISYIYETFLSKEQKDNGIFYTPRKLAQLIVDDVIKEDKIGTILDPSCGAGMFLIVGFQRLLEIAQKQNLEPQNIRDKINFRANLLSENIYGIEKQKIAQRFTLFSLSLQIFEDIAPEEIKKYIESELKENGKVRLFDNSEFYNNIECQNALAIDKPAFENKVFDYIVGNPPFFEIKNTEEFEPEFLFLKTFKVAVETEKKVNAMDIVGKNQISQCFFLKIKDWSNENTRFGFVSNSSNFYNDKSDIFQSFFYKHYGIEIIYELSRVKKMLFEKANESVVSVIFNNRKDFDTIKYYPVETGLFSEKPFELLILQEESVIPIKQVDLISKTVRLRDYLVGNEFDRAIINSIINKSERLSIFLNNNQSNYRGLERIENSKLAKFFNIEKERFDSFSKKEKNNYHLQFSEERYITKELISKISIPYLYSAKKLSSFKISNDLFIKIAEINSNNFRRPGKYELFEEEKILFNRFGSKINAAYANLPIAFSTYVYCITLNESIFYYLITAILNSNLVNYFLNNYYKKRVEDNFTNIDVLVIKNIPIPQNLDDHLVAKISAISKDLTEGIYEFAEKENEINELIYDLYDLNYNERQRINDFFVEAPNKKTTPTQIENYKEAINDYLSMYFAEKIIVEAFEFASLQVIKLSFGNEKQPIAKKVGFFILNEIFEVNPSANILLGQEIIIGKEVIYIARKNIAKKWTETKAYEDSKYILNSINYEDE